MYKIQKKLFYFEKSISLIVIPDIDILSFVLITFHAVSTLGQHPSGV